MKTTIEATAKTPRVDYCVDTGEITITGVLIPENPKVFFATLDNIVSECQQKAQKLALTFDFEYFNTGAARYIYNMLQNLKDFQHLAVTWRYDADDEDILESGKEFEDIFEMKFNFEQK